MDAGSHIGGLDRWLLLGFANRWEAVALVVTATSIVRFEELKQLAFAEYVIVGTVASIVVAISLGIIVSVVV